MPESGRHRLFVERLLIVAVVGLIAAVLWSLRILLVVVVGAVVIAVLLRTVADPISRYTGLGPRLATLGAILLVALIAGCAIWLFGSTVASQFAHLSETIPTSWNELSRRIGQLPFGNQLLAAMKQGLDLPTLVPKIVNLAGNAATTLILIVFGAIFFAAQPRLYTRGLVMLAPPDRRHLVSVSLEDSGRALRLWLLGQLISMIVVGLLTGVGLWLAGVPSAMALGLISGLTEGVPYLGPIVGAIPGLLLALTEGPETALWALVVYVAVQQIEGNTLVPIIHRELVSLPPALTLFWIVAAGFLFGIIGLIFAAPMLVVIYVLVKRLYIREALNTDTPLPGEPADEKSGPG
ncbi:AI-2E family transporter [Novosphingobium endophyticum]|uniref:AI-2E family transporter n=2 Tax=Novosphingobium endophyticum TaxID=1955250 RepID=A0A916TUD4_9SPHN|nr:AI-2E family transporter [Novosphingobium endophyticum]